MLSRNSELEALPSAAVLGCERTCEARAGQGVIDYVSAKTPFAPSGLADRGITANMSDNDEEC